MEITPTQETAPAKVYEGDFTFELRLGENIICKRVFSSNYVNLNSFWSADLTETIDDIVEKIKAGVKERSCDFLWENYDPYGLIDDDNNVIGGVVRNLKDERNAPEEFFYFTLAYKDRVVSERLFSASYYPRSVRNTVNIRDLVPYIIERLRRTVSAYRMSYLY